MKNRVLITGGCGFIGHHLVEAILKSTDYDIVVLDRLNYASAGFDRLRDIDAFDDKRVHILSSDFTKSIEDGLAKEIGDIQYILHLGAETHVDNSITDPYPFVKANVEGTFRMLEFAKTLPNLKCFFQFSTDEVFGPAPEEVSTGRFDGGMMYFVGYKEEDRHNPTNPYAATKSGSEMLVKSYRNTYKLPAIITRSMNVFGERQDGEKYIPMCVNKILAGEPIAIHSNAEKTKAGSRFYIHARNVADAYLFLMKQLDDGNNAIIGEDYHITGEEEVDNLRMAQEIADILGKELLYEMVDFHGSRPGHDLRYALDGGKIKKLGWVLPRTFVESLKKTVEWTLDTKNKKWLISGKN